MGTPNREPQEYSRNLIEYEDPGRYIPIIFLLYSWGSLFGVPIRVPLYKAQYLRCHLGFAFAEPQDVNCLMLQQGDDGSGTPD